MNAYLRLLGLLLSFLLVKSLWGQGTFNASNNYVPAGGSTKAFIFDAEGRPYPKANGRVAILDESGTQYLSPNGAGGVALTLDGLFFINGLVVPGVPIGGSTQVKVLFWDRSTGGTFEDALSRASTVVRITNLGGNRTPAATFQNNSNFSGMMVALVWPPPRPLFTYRLEGGQAYLVRSGHSLNGISDELGRIFIPDFFAGFPLVGIDSGVFSGVTDIRAIFIPGSVRQIGPEAFAGCRDLSELVLPEGLTNLGPGAFQHCTALKQIVLPPGLTVVRSNLFRHCTGLTEVVLPNGITEIEEGAFEGCTNLLSLQFPTNLLRLGDRALAGVGVSVVKLPATLTQLGKGVFAGCRALRELQVDPENPVFQSVDGVLLARNGERIVQFPAGRTGSYAIPSGVRRIETDSFSEARGLTGLTIPLSVTNIAAEAFVNCPLTSVRIPGSVASVGLSAFRGLPLRTIELEEGVQSLAPTAFADCVEITEVRTPPSLTRIGQGAFSGCTSLRKVELGGTKQIASLAFSGCVSLTDIRFPENLETVGSRAFSGCRSLSHIAFPSGARLMGGFLFEGCSNLTSLVLPSSLTELVPGLLAGCTGLRELELPASVMFIGNSAFAGCVNLRDVWLPPGLFQIYGSAFRDCRSLVRVHLPVGLEVLNQDAFQGCTALQAVYFEGKPPIGSTVLMVPPAAVLFHLKDVSEWSEFTHSNPVSEWWPSVEVDAVLGGGGPRLQAQWAENRAVVWQTSSQLTPPQWESVLTNRTVKRTAFFTDSTPAVAARFYRVVPAE